MPHYDRRDLRMALDLISKTESEFLSSLIITGFVGSMVNTIFVMGSIYLLFAGQYAAAKDVARTAVFGLIMFQYTPEGNIILNGRYLC